MRFEIQEVLADLACAMSLEMETFKQFHSRSAQFSKGAEFIIELFCGSFINLHQDINKMSTKIIIMFC